MIQFRRIDLARHRDVCTGFREDAYQASFPGSDKWKAYWDKQAYQSWLASHIAAFPDGAWHLWKDDNIIGQLEFSYANSNGHVNLYYLVPAYRGLGFGALAHHHVVASLIAHGCKTATLKLNSANTAAFGFYQKLGWTDQGRKQGADYWYKLKINL